MNKRDQGTFDFQYQEYIEDNYYFYVTTEEIDKEFSLTESVLTNPWLSYFVSTGISNIPVVVREQVAFWSNIGGSILYAQYCARAL